MGCPQLHFSWREAFFSGPGVGGSSRRWGWYAFKRTQEEGSKRVGKVFWLWDVYKFMGGYLRIFTRSPIHSCPWNEYQSIRIQRSSFLLCSFLPSQQTPGHNKNSDSHTCWCRCKQNEHRPSFTQFVHMDVPGGVGITGGVFPPLFY